MIQDYVTGSSAAKAAIAAPEDKTIWIHGSKTIIRTGADYLAEQEIPVSVTRFQALAALQLAGRLDAVIAVMADPATPIITRLAFENALSFERHSKAVTSLAAVLGMSAADLDALFVVASQITA